LTPTFAIYQTSGANQNFLFCDDKGLGIGGDKGYFGLFIDDALHFGHSHPCATFLSPLLSSSEQYKCQSVELWGLEKKQIKNE